MSDTLGRIDMALGYDDALGPDAMRSAPIEDAPWLVLRPPEQRLRDGLADLAWVVCDVWRREWRPGLLRRLRRPIRG